VPVHKILHRPVDSFIRICSAVFHLKGLDGSKMSATQLPINKADSLPAGTPHRAQPAPLDP
jgi:hypothetical protein